jgi:hypothetical protein
LLLEGDSIHPHDHRESLAIQGNEIKQSGFRTVFVGWVSVALNAQPTVLLVGCADLVG